MFGRRPPDKKTGGKGTQILKRKLFEMEIDLVYRSDMILASNKKYWFVRSLTAVPKLSSRYASMMKDAEQSKTTRTMVEHAKIIANSAIAAVDPSTAICNKMSVDDRGIIAIENRTYNVTDYDRVAVVAFGKASAAMAAAIVDQLKGTEVEGVVIAKDGHVSTQQQKVLQSRGVEVFEAGHPVPDSRSVRASERVLQLVSEDRGNQLVFVAISGGGSALFCAPQPPLSLEDLQATNIALLQSGWNICDMNVVRKRLEMGKGGRLAAAISGERSQLVSLVLSDVIGDPLDLIASGPTVPDSSTWHDAWQLTQRLDDGALPKVVRNFLHNGQLGKVVDSPTADHPIFRTASVVLVGNNAVAVNAAAEQAKELGYKPNIMGTRLEGESRELARFFVAMAHHSNQGDTLFALVSELPAALIVGGESTVTLPTNPGKGGRNQEMALQVAIELNKLSLKNAVFASIGTDGTDGPTDAAGAIVDCGVIDRLEGNAGEELDRHNAYCYLDQFDESGFSPLFRVRTCSSIPTSVVLTTDLPQTGPTGTNVADVYFLLLHERDN